MKVRPQVKRADREMCQVTEMAALVMKKLLTEKKNQEHDLQEQGATDTSAKTTYIIK